jgi:hypothetical protein
MLNKKRGAWCAPFQIVLSAALEISRAIRVATVAVKLDGVASSFAGCAAIFAVVRAGAPARRVLTRLWFVCHGSS